MGNYLNPGNEGFKIRFEYVNAVSVSDWGEVSKALRNSADTLNAIWQGRPREVAERMKEAHFDFAYPV